MNNTIVSVYIDNTMKDEFNNQIDDSQCIAYFIKLIGGKSEPCIYYIYHIIYNKYMSWLK